LATLRISFSKHHNKDLKQKIIKILSSIVCCAKQCCKNQTALTGLAVNPCFSLIYLNTKLIQKSIPESLNRLVCS